MITRKLKFRSLSKVLNTALSAAWLSSFPLELAAENHRHFCTSELLDGSSINILRLDDLPEAYEDQQLFALHIGGLIHELENNERLRIRFKDKNNISTLRSAYHVAFWVAYLDLLPGEAAPRAQEIAIQFLAIFGQDFFRTGDAVDEKIVADLINQIICADALGVDFLKG